MATAPNRTLAEVPTLDEVASDPRSLAGLSRTTLLTLLMRNAVVQSALTAAVAAEAVYDHQESAEPDILLEAKEAAARLACTVDYLYRHQDLPFRVSLAAGQIRFSANGIARYIEAKQGRRKP